MQLSFLFPLIIVLSLPFGVLLIIPIGGADMPTVISLLNSYAGLSAVAMGFVLDNKLLVIAGALDGVVGPDPVDHHVPRHEPLVHERAVRRVRPGAGEGSGAASRRHVKQENAEGAAQAMEQAQLGGRSSPATAWRWRRRSSACASCTTS